MSLFNAKNFKWQIRLFYLRRFISDHQGIRHCLSAKNRLYFESSNPGAFSKLNLIMNPIDSMAGISGIFK